MSKLLPVYRFVVMVAAAGLCCLGLSAQEAEERVAAGSVFEIGQDEVGDIGTFDVKPKVQGVYTHPVTKKEGMKASAKFLDGLGTATAGFEWTKRIPLYDKKLLSGANKLATFTAAWLADEANAEQNQPLPLVLGLTSKQVPENVLERTLHLSPPLIHEVEVGEEFITITGLWFGAKKPKVWFEYLTAKNAVKRLNCKVEKPDGQEGRVNAKLKPVYMNPADGASKVVVQVPKMPKGVVWDDLSHVVLDSGSGLAADTEQKYLVVDLATGDVVEVHGAPADLLTNADYKTTKMVFRHIPAGTFTMGSPGDEVGRSTNETQHQVTLTQDFHIGVFEVTQAQYKAVMGGADPSEFKGDHRPVEMVSWDAIRGGTWPSGNPGADTFMDRLRTLTGGYPFDLPTDAQWEYACRAGTTRAYNDYTQNGGTGSDCLTTDSGQDTNLDPLAWYCFNASLQSLEHQEVGTKQANAWGLYDMHGNVWEWCLDWYVADLGVDPVVDPAGDDTGSHRVVRSGGWRADARYCRSAFRDGTTPSGTYDSLGFRVSLAP